MLVTFEIRDDLANEIRRHCQSIEGLWFNDYLAKLIEDAFYTEKYGDLNVIMREEKQQPTPTSIVVEHEATTEEPHMDTIPISPKEENEKTVDTPSESMTDLPHISEDVVEKSQEEIKTKDIRQKRTKRKLNVK